MKNIKYIACSECFQDEGIRQLAIKLGKSNKSQCPHCKSINGNKLTKDNAADILYSYFSGGSVHRYKYGGAPIYAVNRFQEPNQLDNLPKWLDHDYHLLEEVSNLRVFKYGPRFFMTGEIEPLTKLRTAKYRGEILNRIVNEFPCYLSNSNDKFYRLRKSPKYPNRINEYDSPPASFKSNGRFSKTDFPILYLSTDIEICVHECRSSVDDEMYISTIIPKSRLKLLDLTAYISEPNINEFESLRMAIYYLFLAKKNSYPICRALAEAARLEGYDGLIYPSYFSYLRNDIQPFIDTILGLPRLMYDKVYSQSIFSKNVALFGYPIKEEKVNVISIDKIIIKGVKYDLSYGPLMPM